MAFFWEKWLKSHKAFELDKEKVIEGLSREQYTLDVAKKFSKI